MLSLTFVRQEGLLYRLESDEVTPDSEEEKLQNSPFNYKIIVNAARQS